MTAPGRSTRLRGPLRGARGVGIACAAVAIALVLAGMVGAFAPSGRGTVLWQLGAPLRALTGAATAPTPQRAVNPAPLGAPSRVAVADGPHRFMATQPGGTEPVAYDPCRPVPYVVNARTAPEGGPAALATAIAEIEGATGLDFVDEGTTAEVPTDDRAPFQPDRYGDRWAPVLIAWSDPAEQPALAGDVLGRAGSVELTTAEGSVYVTGSVTLDGPELAALAAHRGRRPLEAVILHELGHLVGLDHVADPSQLMATQTSRVTQLQSGDIAGLNRLGAGRCITEL